MSRFHCWFCASQIDTAKDEAVALSLVRQWALRPFYGTKIVGGRVHLRCFVEIDKLLRSAHVRPGSGVEGVQPSTRNGTPRADRNSG